MFKKASLFILIILITFSTGCNENDYSITTYKKEPMVSSNNESEVIITLTVIVYHKDGYVKKTELIQENVLKDGDIKDLKLYFEGTEETFKSEEFNIKGYKYSSEFTGTSFTFVTAYDYSKMDIKQLVEDGKTPYHVIGKVDENYEIPYDKYIEGLTELGFVIELAD